MANYIIPNFTKYNSHKHFFEAEKDDYLLRYIDDQITNPIFEELYNLKYVMVIGEPGYGKTRLLKELAIKAHENHSKVLFIDSKQIKNSIEDSLEKCTLLDSDISEEELQKESYFKSIEEYSLDEDLIVCFDALDELAFSSLYNFFEKIDKFISSYPNVKVFLSCRTHHLKKIEYDLQSLPFEYLTLEKFYGKQVSTYLKDNGLNQQDINDITKKSKLVNLYDYLTIPRYLYYFTQLIKNRNFNDIMNLSRSEIFEEFIYRKINKERSQKDPESENYAIKRILEELALVMKIYQVSQISKDDFFTIFKELNLGNIFTGKGLIEKLTDKSLLKDNIDYLEFENQEFLDFLAAKEINRFEKVEQVFFDMAVEPRYQEVFASWFYVMPFVLEQQPYMVDILLDFLEKNSEKVLRQGYFDVITSIDPKSLNEDTKSRIFNTVFDYYTKHNSWIYMHASKLVYFYNEAEHYDKIMHSIDEVKQKFDVLEIRRRNALELVEELSRHKILTLQQLENWKRKLLSWLKFDPKIHKNLHSAIISSSSIIMRNDFDWIQETYFIFENGIDLQHDYSRTCYKIKPNHKFSIDIYFTSHKKFKENQLDRANRLDDNVKFICNVDTAKGIKYILEKLKSSENINYFLNKSYKSKFRDDLEQFVLNISNNLDIKMINLVKSLIKVLLIEIRVKYNENGKSLLSSLFKIVKSKDSKYIFEFIDLMYELYDNNQLSFWDFEESVIDELSPSFNSQNFTQIYKKLQKFEKDNRTLEYIMCQKLYYDHSTKDSVKKAIEKLYKQEIEEYEKNTKKYAKKRERDERNRQLGLCSQWAHKIEPEPNKFITDLFSFYINNKQVLEECENFQINKEKTIKLAKSVIKHNNPLDGKVEVNGNSTTIWGVHYYKEAITLLHSEGINLSVDEQDIIDNTFRYLPFDINSEYESTLTLGSNPSSEAIQDILDVYSNQKEDDLGISHPENFIQIYKNMPIKEAEPLLMKMLENSEVREYVRSEIIDILPNTVLTLEKIKSYIEINGENDVLYEDMLSAAIKKYNDSLSIDKAFNFIIRKGNGTQINESESSLWGTPLDLDKSYNLLVHILIKTDYSIDLDKKLLLDAVNLRKQGRSINAYFFEEIVFRHLKYWNHIKSFEPLIEIEKFLLENRDKTNLVYFEFKIKELKDIYLEELSKPKHIMEAIKLYKKSKQKEYLVVNSPLHLLEIVKDSVNKEITNWIEVEGAYKHIQELAKKNKNTNAEDFIQKTLKPQIELALLKRGLRYTDIKIKREEQTLDDKRADFTISYGFVGQVLLELKLSHNPESNPDRKPGKDYKYKLKKYIDATNSNNGIFIIFNVKENSSIFNRQMQKLAQEYNDEDNIHIMGIDCIN